MQFNSEELIAIATYPSYKFNKEGTLFEKEKQVFFKRWCRLLGNLLFCYKTENQYSEPAEVFVLEDYRVCLDESSEVPYCFSLIFKHDEAGQKLGAYSESERDAWVQALHRASFEYMQLQLSTLQAKLAAMKVTNWNNSEVIYSKRQRSFTTGSSYDSQHYEPFMELDICCDNLMCDVDGRVPNPMVCILINTPPSARWTRFAQTEIIEKSSNPRFFVTVTFIEGEVTEYTRIKLSVCDVKERVACVSTLLGESVFKLETLLQSHQRMLRLNLVSHPYGSVGFVSISPREMSNTKQRNTRLMLTEEESLCSKVERTRSYSLPTKITSHVVVPELELLKSIYNNFVIQTYCFPTSLRTELHVHEIMSESKLSFTVPCMLLDLWISEEKKMMKILFELDGLLKERNQKVLAAANGHLQLINYYTEIVDFLLNQKRSSFKPSTKKFDHNFEFVPTNLHVQRMWIQNIATCKTGVYDIITVGMFAAYSQKFPRGGLLRLLNQLRSYYPSFSTDNSCAILGPDPISHSAEAIIRIEELQKEIESDIQTIIDFWKQKNEPNIHTVLNSLSNKGDQLTRVCAPHLVEEILSVWNTLQSSSNVIHGTNTSSNLFGSSGSTSQDKRADEESIQTKSEKEFNSNAANTSSSISDHTSENNKPSCSQSTTVSSNLINILEIEPLDRIHLNVRSSIMCMRNKVESFISENSKEMSAEPGESLDKLCSWVVELMPSIKNLRQAIQCLMKTAKLTFSIMSLKESTKCLSLCQEVRYRRDIVFSQALTSLVAGLMTRLWCRNPDSMFIHMLRTIGVFCHFEGLLSCHGSAIGALEDMVVGMDDLRRVLFWLEPSTSCNPQPRIEGSRLFLHVFIPTPLSIISLLPVNCYKGWRLTVNSVFFNIGINENATFAEEYGDTSLQDKINQDNLSLLKGHFSKFQRIDKSQKDQGFHYAENRIAALLEELQFEIYSKKCKNVAILHLSSEICKYFGGIRFTSCKSAKDRTGMSVTLEQALVLLRDFDLDDKEMPRVLECMRSEGTRTENTLKNLGKRKYHFNHFQLQYLPNQYRPPPGTYTDIFEA